MPRDWHLPGFGGVPETLMAHSILAVSQGYRLVVSELMEMPNDGPTERRTCQIKSQHTATVLKHPASTINHLE